MNYTGLLNLKANKVRIATLTVEIQKLRNIAKLLENDININTTARYDPMAGYRKQGTHGDMIGNTALDRAMGNPTDELKCLLVDINIMTMELYRTQAWVQLAESALNFLPERERAIVNYRAVEQFSWEMIADALSDEYGIILSLSSIRHIYNRATEKIKPFFVVDSMDSTKPQEPLTKRMYVTQTAIRS